MTKQVIFNEESNQQWEFERIPLEEKQNFWVTKAEIRNWRKDHQAEALLKHTRDLVTKTVLESSKDNSLDEQNVAPLVDEIMKAGIDTAIDFLTENGVDLAAAPPPPATKQMGLIQGVTTTTKSKQRVENKASQNYDVIMRQNIRQLIKAKLQKEHPDRTEHEVELALDEIMNLPKEQIRAYLQNPVKRKQEEINWANSSAFWDDLPSDIQQAARDLGYDQESWDNSLQPDESNKLWDDLTPLQQQACVKLGYTKYQWDNIAGEETEKSKKAKLQEDANFASDDDSVSSSASSSSSSSSTPTEEEEESTSQSESTRGDDDDFLESLLSTVDDIQEPQGENVISEEKTIPNPVSTKTQTSKILPPRSRQDSKIPVFGTKHDRIRTRPQHQTHQTSISKKATTSSDDDDDWICNIATTGVQNEVKFQPFVHSFRGPCELCVFYLSEDEKTKLHITGRSLRVMQTSGGCCRDCQVFPRKEHESPVRLCRACFFNSHRFTFQKSTNGQGVLGYNMLEA